MENGKEKPQLSKDVDPIGDDRAGYWSEAVHGARMRGKISSTYQDRNDRRRYRFQIEGRELVVLPDHYNLNQKLEAIDGSQTLAGQTIEILYCGRTLTDAAGARVNDKQGKQMYEWLVGIVPAKR